ncbi:MAG: GNAT family N-acetyltransferase, partial [Clostridia bacterium]|nr:GNAT family N-acetyltransferase [Clostridia bacterium]
KEITRAVLNDFMEHKNVFAVCLNEDDRAIGSLGIHRSWTEGRSGYEGLKAVEIGYVLSKAHWGKGLMPEAVRLVLSYLFEDLNMDAVTVGHFPENTQSRRVIEKCGFVFAENGIFHAANLGKDIPEMRYIMKANDFLS